MPESVVGGVLTNLSMEAFTAAFVASYRRRTGVTPSLSLSRFKARCAARRRGRASATVLSTTLPHSLGVWSGAPLSFPRRPIIEFSLVTKSGGAHSDIEAGATDQQVWDGLLVLAKLILTARSSSTTFPNAFQAASKFWISAKVGSGFALIRTQAVLSLVTEMSS